MTAGNTQLPLVFSSADYVGVSWAARALGCSPSTILRMLESGELVGHQPRNKGWWRIRKDSVIAYMAKVREMEQQ